MRRKVLLAVIGSLCFAFGFPAIARFLSGGGLFAAFFAIPLAFIAWNWGERAALLAAIGGAIYINAVLLAENLVVQHRSISMLWVLTVLLFDLIFLCLSAVVGRLGEVLKEKGIAEDGHRLSTTRLLAVLKALPDHVFEFDRYGRVHDFQSSRTDSLRDPLGPSPVGQSILELLPLEVSSAVMNAIVEAGEGGQSRSQVFPMARGGTTKWYELSVAAIGDYRDPECRFIALGRDITERKNLEQQLIQSQKMEAVGRLAGGIAHDFNNILQAIIGFSDLILMKKGERREVDRHMNIIRDSAIRAASLTQHLLAFSRKQMLAPKVVDADELIEESLQMLRRMIGENISITHESEAAANLVRVDPGQLGQVITNLAVNARDAMPFGGRLRIKVVRVELAAEDSSRPTEMLPGEYVLITVSDTGIGMDQEVLSHLFEPFFTTKVLGKGTGLGLSIVYGVIKQSGGYIFVESKLGGGTTFSIYLPRVHNGGENPMRCSEEEHYGTETILLVEDEDEVRHLIFQHLTSCGYRVLQARDGKAALGMCRKTGGQIQLLLADVVLPDIRGDRIAQEFRLANPLGRVIFMTGYIDSAGFVEAAEKENAIILQKPLTLSELAMRIRRVLSQPQQNG